MEKTSSKKNIRRRKRLLPTVTVDAAEQCERDRKTSVGNSALDSKKSNNDKQHNIWQCVFEQDQQLFLFALLVIFRLLNVLFIRSAFDPDEYWQTLEPAYCSVFADTLACNSSIAEGCCHLTWEWTRRASIDNSSCLGKALYGPVRSYLSVLPTHLLYRYLRALGWDSSWLVARGPMVLQAITVAAPVDWLTWYTAKQVYKDASVAQWALFGSLTSWFGAFCGVRTYANCQEAVLLLAAMALVSKNIPIYDPLVFLLGGIAIGIRFTALVAFVPLGLFLARRRSRNAKDFVLYVMQTCAACGLLGLAVSLAVDRFFYGFWALPFLGNFHFNAVLGMSNLYGSHPWHWYVTAGVPAVAGLMTPLLPIAFWDRMEGNQIIMLRWVVLCYVAVLSMSSHKEFRFLLPTLPLFIVLTAPFIRRLLRARPIVVLLWIIINVIAVGFLGMFHQTGAISVNREIVQVMERRARTTTEPTLISIHYLLPCHTTPSRSHLHSPGNFQVAEVWHLDCSPSCRISNTCESEAFARDPEQFLGRTYQHKRAWPDFIVTMSETEEFFREVLPSTFRLVARFPYTMAGIQCESWSSFHMSTNDILLFSRLN